MIETPSTCTACQRNLEPHTVRCPSCDAWTLGEQLSPALVRQIGLDYQRQTLHQLRQSPTPDEVTRQALTLLESRLEADEKQMFHDTAQSFYVLASPTSGASRPQTLSRPEDAARRVPPVEVLDPPQPFTPPLIPTVPKEALPTLPLPSLHLPTLHLPSLHLPSYPEATLDAGLDWQRLRPLVAENFLWFIGALMTLVGAFYFTSTHWDGLSPLIKGLAILGLIQLGMSGFAALSRYLARQEGLELPSQVLGTLSLALLPAACVPLSWLLPLHPLLGGLALLESLGLAWMLVPRASTVWGEPVTVLLRRAWLGLAMLPALLPLLSTVSVSLASTMVSALALFPYLYVLWRHNTAPSPQRQALRLPLLLHAYGLGVVLLWARPALEGPVMLPLAAVLGLSLLYLELARSHWRGISRLHVSRPPVLLGLSLLLAVGVWGVPAMLSEGWTFGPALGVLLASGGVLLSGLLWRETSWVKLSIVLSLLAYGALIKLVWPLSLGVLRGLEGVLGTSWQALDPAWLALVGIPYGAGLSWVGPPLERVQAGAQGWIRHWQAGVMAVLALWLLSSPDGRPLALGLPLLLGVLGLQAWRTGQRLLLLETAGLLTLGLWRGLEHLHAGLSTQGLGLLMLSALLLEVGQGLEKRGSPEVHTRALRDAGLGVMLLSTGLGLLSYAAQPTSALSLLLLAGLAGLGLRLTLRWQVRWMLLLTLGLVGLAADGLRGLLALPSDPLVVPWLALGLLGLAIFWPRRRGLRGLRDALERDPATEPTPEMLEKLTEPIGWQERLAPVGLFSGTFWQVGQWALLVGTGLVWLKRLQLLSMVPKVTESMGLEALHASMLPGLALILAGLLLQAEKWPRARPLLAAWVTAEALSWICLPLFYALLLRENGRVELGWLVGLALVFNLLGVRLLLHAPEQPLGRFLRRQEVSLLRGLLLLSPLVPGVVLGGLVAASFGWLAPSHAGDLAGGLVAPIQLPWLLLVGMLGWLGLTAILLSSTLAVWMFLLVSLGLLLVLPEQLGFGAWGRAWGPFLLVVPGALLLREGPPIRALGGLLSRLEARVGRLLETATPDLSHELLIQGLRLPLGGLTWLGLSLGLIFPGGGHFVPSFGLSMLALGLWLSWRWRPVWLALLPSSAAIALNWGTPTTLGLLSVGAVGLLVMSWLLAGHQAGQEAGKEAEQTSQQTRLHALALKMAGVSVGGGLLWLMGLDGLREGFHSPLLGLQWLALAVVAGGSFWASPQRGLVYLSVGAAHVGLAGLVLHLGGRLSTGQGAAAILPALALLSGLLLLALEGVRRRSSTPALSEGVEGPLEVHLVVLLGELLLAGMWLAPAGVRSDVLVALALGVGILAQAGRLARQQQEGELFGLVLLSLAGLGWLFFASSVSPGLQGVHGRLLLGGTLLVGAVGVLGVHAWRLAHELRVLREGLSRLLGGLVLLVLLLGWTQPERGLMAGAGLVLLGLHALEGRARWLLLGSSLLNFFLLRVLFEQGVVDPQLYAAPVGLTVLVLVQRYRRQLSPQSVLGMRSVGLTLIYAASYVQSWVAPLNHLIMLSLCLAGVLLGVKMRIRSFLYAGTGGLVATMLTVLIRFGWAHPEYNAVYLISLGLSILGGMVIFTWQRQRLHGLRQTVQTQLEEWE
ncbi:MAG: hypothetical protein ACKO6N_07830 [Myxococcota bacterium]